MFYMICIQGNHSHWCMRSFSMQIPILFAITIGNSIIVIVSNIKATAPILAAVAMTVVDTPVLSIPMMNNAD